jgi:hypothetical protein
MNHECHVIEVPGIGVSIYRLKCDCGFSKLFRSEREATGYIANHQFDMVCEAMGVEEMPEMVEAAHDAPRYTATHRIQSGIATDNFKDEDDRERWNFNEEHHV